METFGERLRYLRQEKNIGQIQLAKELDVGKSIISLWEQGRCEPTLSKLIAMEKGIEINTAALARGMREPNPCIGILKRYRALGGEIITAGSDAHEPRQIAHAFDQAAEILKECGFRYYTTFEKRIPAFHKL